MSKSIIPSDNREMKGNGLVKQHYSFRRQAMKINR